MKPADHVLEGLDQDESFIYRWQYRKLGDFGAALVRAYTLADEDNQDCLALGFPYECEALERYFREEGWWTQVQEKCEKLGYLQPGQR